MHFHKMPSWPQDALCSLNNKMHGIGGDGLACQAAREWQPLPSTRSRDDKRKSGTWVLAWRVELGSELHLFFTADDKHIQIDLSFSPDLEKLLLMRAHNNNPQNRGIESADWHTNSHSLCSAMRAHIHTVLLPFTFFLCKIWRGVWQLERRLSENNEASISHHHSNNYSSISSSS